MTYLKCWEKKIVSQFYKWQNYPSGVKEKLRYSKINLKGFITVSALQEILKGVFPAKMKRHWAVTKSHVKK